MLKEIYCLNDHAQIYIMDIYNPYPIGHEMHEITEVYAAYKENECRYTLIDYNNVHPNTLGYKIINDCYKSITII